MKQGDNSVTIACASMNSPKHDVYDWYQQWRTSNLGPRKGPDIIVVSGLSSYCLETNLINMFQT